MVSSFSHRPLTFQMPLHPLWPANAACLSAQGLANISSTAVTHHTDAIYPALFICFVTLAHEVQRLLEIPRFSGLSPFIVGDLEHDSDCSAPPTKLLLMAQRQCAGAWACREQVAPCKVVSGSVEMRTRTGECWPVLLSALICQIDLKTLARCAPASCCGSWLSLKGDK